MNGPKDQLNAHLKTHAANKPYTCDFCPETFKYPYSKMRHMTLKRCKN